jgi:hypothetical protein
MKTSRRAEARPARAPGAITVQEQVLVSVADIAGAAKEGLLALAVGTGPHVMTAIFDEDVVRLCGPKGKHCRTEPGYRFGESPAAPIAPQPGTRYPPGPRIPPRGSFPVPRQEDQRGAAVAGTAGREPPGPGSRPAARCEFAARPPQQGRHAIAYFSLDVRKWAGRADERGL